jgi:hypothetical protein
MKRTESAIVMLAAAIVVTAGAPAAAEVRDAVYRGTLVCDKLPFTEKGMREAIDVTISGSTASYSHIVRLREAPETAPEKGAGKVDGQSINLEGSWKGSNREYQAKYSGTFVRRSALLKGTQTWSEGGKTVVRSCSGAIKRPLRAFLPRAKKTP